MTVSPAPPASRFRALPRGGCSEIRLIDLDGNDLLVLRSDRLVEAPNWAPDGRTLIVNMSGGLYRLPLDRPVPEHIPTDWIDFANNDHLLSADGRTIFFTAAGMIFSVPVAGGVPTRLSPDGATRFYLHGISPDAKRLACTSIAFGEAGVEWGLQYLPIAGGEAETLFGTGQRPVDGPEWTPDGQWIWFNGELDDAAPGTAKLFRIRPDGRDMEQMSFGPGVDWFPHPSPDGRWIAFLRYQPGTEGHPADLPVELCIMPAAGGEPRILRAFTGGQGTINVPSWAPDSSGFAYAAYPVRGEAKEGNKL